MPATLRAVSSRHHHSRWMPSSMPPIRRCSVAAGWTARFIALPGRNCWTNAADWAAARLATPSSPRATGCLPASSSIRWARCGTAAARGTGTAGIVLSAQHRGRPHRTVSARWRSRPSARVSTATRSSSRPSLPRCDDPRRRAGVSGHPGKSFFAAIRRLTWPSTKALVPQAPT